MKVTAGQIVARGFTNRCPNCGQRTLFPPKSFRVNRRCPACGVGFDRGDGFFLGPWVLNYSVTVFLFVVPAIVLGARGVLPWTWAVSIAALAALGLPLLVYRASWSWWLALYFFFLPENLPANGGPVHSEAEED